jgi:hypothetical protein
LAANIKALPTQKHIDTRLDTVVTSTGTQPSKEHLDNAITSLATSSEVKACLQEQSLTSKIANLALNPDIQGLSSTVYIDEKFSECAAELMMKSLPATTVLEELLEAVAHLADAKSPAARIGESMTSLGKSIVEARRSSDALFTAWSPINSKMESVNNGIFKLDLRLGGLDNTLNSHKESMDSFTAALDNNKKAFVKIGKLHPQWAGWTSYAQDRGATYTSIQKSMNDIVLVCKSLPNTGAVKSILKALEDDTLNGIKMGMASCVDNEAVNAFKSKMSKLL